LTTHSIPLYNNISPPQPACCVVSDCCWQHSFVSQCCVVLVLFELCLFATTLNSHTPFSRHPTAGRARNKSGRCVSNVRESTFTMFAALAVAVSCGSAILLVLAVMLCAGKKKMNTDPAHMTTNRHNTITSLDIDMDELEARPQQTSHSEAPKVRSAHHTTRLCPLHRLLCSHRFRQGSGSLATLLAHSNYLLD
jgi:hypothetical protein